MSNQGIRTAIRVTLFVLITSSCISWSCNRPKIIELSFETQDTGFDEDEKTLLSIQKVGNMYTVNYYGDYEDRLKWLNDYHVKESARLDQKSHCSLFAAYTKTKEPLLGRNFDRLSETPVLGKYSAPGKFASFAFSPGSEVYLKEVLGVSDPTEEQRNKFLFCLPFYATDGINEKGLSIAIAGAPPHRVKRPEKCEPMFVLLFIRHVLDNCQSVEEVARFAESVSLYDSDLGTISHHFVAVDAKGQWLIIDYPDGKLRLSRGQGEPKARTNHFLEGGPAIDNTSFWRYDIINDALKSTKPLDSEREAMDLLRQVRHDTQWSVVYKSQSCGGFVAVQEQFRTQYHFGFSKANP